MQVPGGQGGRQGRLTGGRRLSGLRLPIKYNFVAAFGRAEGNPKRLEGVLLPTVETEANGDSRSTYERGPSLAGSFGS